MPTDGDHFDQALALHRAGRLREAEPLYRQVLEGNPQRTEAWHFLGVLEHQTGRQSDAIEHIRRAIALDGRQAPFYNHLGEALRAAGRGEEALASYRAAIELQPRFAEAHYNRAVALQGLGRPIEAIAAFQRAVQIKPDYASAWNNLAGLLRGQDRWDDALAAFREAIRVQPDYAMAHNNLGAALSELGRTAEAESAYHRAIECRPDFAPAHYNLGHMFQKLGQAAEALPHFERAARLQPSYAEALLSSGMMLAALGRNDEAIERYRDAIRVRPHYADAHYNLGHMHRERGEWNEAIACFRAAVQFKPDNPDAHTSLGIVLAASGRPAEAVLSYQRATELRPGDVGAWNNLGNVLKDVGHLDEAAACYREALRQSPEFAEAHTNLGAALSRQGQLDDSVAAYREALRLSPALAEAHGNLANALMDQGRLADAVTHYREALRLKPDFHEAHSNMLFCLAHDPRTPPASIVAAHRHWAEVHGTSPAEFLPHTNEPDPERPLRIGYVSCDFRTHAVTRFFEPILENHDRSKFQIYCYSQVQVPDATTERLQSLADAWRTIYAVPDEKVVDIIRADRIDILVDLAGHTAGHRLPVFARRPAPVQATYLGYPHTTGMDAIDYRITDAVFDPPGEEIFSTERLVRLPNGLCCFSSRGQSLEVPPLPAHVAGRITFGSLHRLAKLNEGVFDLWARVLQAVPGSRLLMYRDTLKGRVRDDIERQFVSRGVAAERLDLRGSVDEQGYLGVFQEIDISLDTSPYTGGTISCESLWMGVPLVTLRGDRPAARGGAALLTIVGLESLIADSADDYVRLAADLAADLGRLESLRFSLRERFLATLGNARRFTQTLEAAYRDMWRTWCSSRS